MRQVYFFKLLLVRCPVTPAALLSLGLTNVTGSPSILTRSQKRAHPSSCALRIIVGADDGVVQDLVPDDDTLFGAKSADPTSDSDSTTTSTRSRVEEDEPGAKRSRLADEWSESESDDDSDDDGGDDLVSTSDDDGQKPSLGTSLEDFDRALARGYGCKGGNHSSVLPAQHVASIQCRISRASSREEIPSSLACCLLDIVARAPCWCACEEKISF